MAEWISVKDRLPEDGSIVLCYHQSGYGGGIMFTAQFTDWRGREYDWAVTYGGHFSNITHWQPLPSPPEVNDG